MLTLPPKGKHNGVLVFIDRPNRYDIANNCLLAGPPGMFLRETLRDCNVDPDLCYFTTDLYINPAKVGIVPTKILLLGHEAAARSLYGNPSDSLNNLRGIVGKTPSRAEVISSYEPVDCTDVVDHESALFDSDDEDDDGDSGSNNKDSAPTARRNYRFWLRSDVRKLLLNERRRNYKYDAITNYTTRQIINWLDSQRDTFLYFDIETHPPTDTVQCFSIAAINGPAIQVPCYDYRTYARHHLPQLFAALVRAFTRNVIVGHNISFDLGFLFHFHGVPFGHRLYDTMLAHHRCFPEAEKSLGHAMSYWVNVDNHKNDAGTFCPYNHQQYQTLLDYNTRDVLVLREIHLEQCAYSRNDPGLTRSITQANTVQFDYLVAGLRGINIDNAERKKKVTALTSVLTDYTRVLKILTGMNDFNPSSGQQIGRWLYEGLGYPIIEKTETGAGKTDIKTLYKLLQKFPNNVALKVLLKYKAEDKVLSMLGFEDYYVNEEREMA